MESRDPRLRQIWNQREIPVILRRTGNGERLRLRLPGELSSTIDDRRWLRNARRMLPHWKRQGSYWEIPKKWFNDFVERCLKRFGHVHIIQPFRETEVCARPCMEATGHECQCSCMGANHGAGMDGSWFEIGEAFAVRSGSPKLACRLLVAKDSN